MVSWGLIGAITPSVMSGYCRWNSMDNVYRLHVKHPIWLFCQQHIKYTDYIVGVYYRVGQYIIKWDYIMGLYWNISYCNISK